MYMFWYCEENSENSFGICFGIAKKTLSASYE